MKDNSVGPGNEAGAAKVSEKWTVEMFEGHWYLKTNDGKIDTPFASYGSPRRIADARNSDLASLRSELEQAREALRQEIEERENAVTLGLKQTERMSLSKAEAERLREVIEQKDNLLNGVREIAHSTKHRASLIHEIRQLLPVTTKRP